MKHSNSIFDYCKLILALCFVLLSQLLAAQTCEERVEQAKLSYAQGRLIEIPPLLDSCSQSQSEEIRFATHRLLALAYLGLDNELKARKSAVEILKIDPTYKGNVFEDPKAFTDLLKEITVIPRMTLGLSGSAGSNYSFPQVLTSYSLTEHNDWSYEGVSGWLIGLDGSYLFSERLSLFGSLQVLQKSFTIDYGTQTLKLQLEERNSHLQLPLGFRYSIPLQNRWQPYIQIGGFASYLIESRSSHFYEDHYTNESHSVLDLSATNRRNRWGVGLTLGAGALYRLGPGQLTGQIGFNYALSNISKTGSKYSNETVTYQYFHVDDDVLLHQVYFSLGYNLFLNYKIVE